MRPKTPVEARFWPKVRKTATCWLWTGSEKHNGYGQIFFDGGPKRVHRISWVIHFGKIPKGKWVLHRCDNRCCVNPEHLFLGTAEDNTADMMSKNRCSRIGRKGEDNPSAKLSDKDIESIRILYVPRRLRKSGIKYLSLEEVAKRFNICQSYVSTIAAKIHRL
jgi:hypothetical protein